MSNNNERKRGRESGSVLITVIWVLSVLTVFTVVVNRRASQELLLARWVKEQTLSRILAQSGIERVLYDIQKDEFITFDALNETWASNPLAMEALELPGGTVQVRCGDLTDSAGNPIYLYGACDESARINLNTADEATLANLFKAASKNVDDTQAAVLAQSIIDWRDQDDATQQSGAESAYYRFLPLPYDAKNSPFESVEELRMIRGVTPELYDLVKGAVTVYTKGPVNLNTAGRLALQALGLSPELAEKVLLFRAGNDGAAGTEDDGIFQTVESIGPSLSTQGSFSGEEFKMVTDAISTGNVTVKSDVFRIRSISRFIRSGQEIVLGVTCVITRRGTVLYWNETAE